MTNKTYPNTALAFLIRFLKKYKLTFAETQHLLFDEESSGAFNHSRIRPTHRSISDSKYASPI